MHLQSQNFKARKVLSSHSEISLIHEMRKVEKLNGLSKFGDRIRTVQAPDSHPSAAKNFSLLMKTLSTAKLRNQVTSPNLKFILIREWNKIIPKLSSVSKIWRISFS